MQYISFRALESSDSGTISYLLENSPSWYTKYFHPFAFDASSLQQILENRKKDQFFGIELQSTSSNPLIGFYMFRGLDEGYSDPMYGVFVSHQYCGKGIARATISHAECFCRLNNYKKLLLKVHPRNSRAKELYESLGFQYLKADTSNGNIVFYKTI